MATTVSPIDSAWLKEALVRYNVQGPRYTSYPTAPQWRDPTKEEAEHEAIQQASQPGKPLSVYVHIPFCDRRCLFCGCNVVIRPRRESIGDAYIGYFEKELDLRLRHFKKDRRLTQFHFGGGTPTFLTPAQLERMSRRILSSFTPEPDFEFSIEIDPCEVEEEHISRLRALGLNRVSLGVQDFDPTVQDLVKRHQTVEQTENVMRWAREAGIQFINVDLIYGLPGQTLETFRNSIEQVIRMGATRLAIYSFAHIPWIKPHQKRIDPARLPDAETKLNLYIQAFTQLTTAGFVAIGMDHFALPGDEMTLAQANGTLHRNFMGYTTRAGTDLLGLGASAISFSASRYTQNQKELKDYQTFLDGGILPIEKVCVMTRDDDIRLDLITQIICNFQLDIPAFEKRHNLRFGEYFAAEADAVASLEREGLLRVGEGRLQVTPQGRFFVRNICMAFDAYLKKAPEGERPLYSRTI